MLSLQKTRSKPSSSDDEKFEQIFKNLEKNFGESLMIENQFEIDSIGPWETSTNLPFNNILVRNFNPNLRTTPTTTNTTGSNSFEIQNPLPVPCQNDEVRECQNKADLVDPLEPVDPSEFELYKENDVLYPTLATLPHLDLDCPVRLAVMGAREVGKSALAVRYLSGQQSNLDPKPGVVRGCEIGSKTRRPRLSASQGVEVEIIDVPFKVRSDASWMSECKIKTNEDPGASSQSSANVIVVLYSITDRGSFHIAREILESLRQNGSVDPILLLANKSDLSHLRQVCLTEGREMSRQFDAAFQEVSVANCPEIAIDVLNKLIRHLRNARKQERASQLTDRVHPDSSNPDTGIPELAPLHNVAHERTRKFSVFNAAGRMLNNLLLFGSRSSMPPELPSSPTHGGATSRMDMPDGLPHNGHNTPGHHSENFSFKNVFKKRSV